jgi:transposase-like protein
MARKVRQIRRKGKDLGIVPVPPTAAPDLDTRIALIQALIPVALERVHEELTEDVKRLAGERYAWEDRLPGHVRWTHQRGSIYLADQKIPIDVPRVRDRLRNQEIPLPTYERLQQPRALDTGLLHKVIGGLSTREYERCAEAVPEAFGLSASTVSRRFKRATARKLRELTERRLEGYDLVALILDGKTFAEDEMVAAVGITITGEKVLLGFVQTATENRKVCATFLRDLVERGVRMDLGLLVVTDGAKGLHAAVREVFGAAALLQRCQWHKRENVLQYLAERHRATFRRKLQGAYEQPTYEAAKRALAKPHREGRSLEEQRAEATMACHRTAGSRTPAAAHQELSRAPALARSAQAATGRCEETGGVNKVGRCRISTTNGIDSRIGAEYVYEFLKRSTKP